MPLRTFTCEKCGRTERVFQTLHEELSPPCSCGGKTFRDYTQESGNRNCTGAFRTPIEMASIGPVMPDELPAFKQACPQVDLTPEGVPLARTRHQKLQVLRHFGMQEKR